MPPGRGPRLPAPPARPQTHTQPAPPPRRRPQEDGFDNVVYVDDSDDDVDFTADWEGVDEADARPRRQRASVSIEVRAFDQAIVNVRSGDGGNGCVAFRREKFVSMGGPAGGNGGRGGNVWVVADEGMSSLLHFRRRVHWRALPGTAGEGSKRAGANAPDVFVPVPVGTVVRLRDDPDGAPIAELLEAGDRALVAVGGRGGRGNATFKTATNRAPLLAEEGEKGQELWLSMEMKVVADVGIVGVPNAGKSTLLSVLSAAKPKIANYPFTTLTPNLGVCELDMRTTVFADIPGLLEGAHAGKGLGIEFLKHCERSRMLVHVIDGTSRDPIHDFEAINAELELFNPRLADKPQIVAYNKMDVPDSSDYYDLVSEYLTGKGLPAPLPVSAATGRGVTELVRAVRAALDELPEEELVRQVENVTAVPRKAMGDKVEDFTVEVEEGWGRKRRFVVRGQALEKFTQMTNFNYFEGLLRFQRVLEAAGVVKRLSRLGVAEGEDVAIGDVMEFEWTANRSQGALYDAWLKQRTMQAPHAGG